MPVYRYVKQQDETAMQLTTKSNVGKADVIRKETKKERKPVQSSVKQDSDRMTADWAVGQSQWLYSALFSTCN
jgi:hypothetical protein